MLTHGNNSVAANAAASRAHACPDGPVCIARGAVCKLMGYRWGTARLYMCIYVNEYVYECGAVAAASICMQVERGELASAKGDVYAVGAMFFEMVTVHTATVFVLSLYCLPICTVVMFFDIVYAPGTSHTELSGNEHSVRI